MINKFILLLIFSIIVQIQCGLITRDDLGTSEELEMFAVAPTNHAKVARQLVHKSAWTAFGTISSLPELKGFPMVNIISVADSKLNAKSTGHIYFLLTMLDFTAQDISKLNNINLLFSQDQDLSCTRNNTDPMEPTCARVIISGSARKLKNNTDEYDFGYKAFLDRHPAADNWIKTHNFFLCTIDISSVKVLDWYGGPHPVTPKEYYSYVDEDDNDYTQKDSDDSELFNFNTNEIDNYKNQRNNNDEVTSHHKNGRSHHKIGSNIKIRITEDEVVIDL